MSVLEAAMLRDQACPDPDARLRGYVDTDKLGVVHPPAQDPVVAPAGHTFGFRPYKRDFIASRDPEVIALGAAVAAEDFRAAESIIDALESQRS